MSPAHRSGPFRALGLEFEIEFDDHELSRAVARTFDCMHASGPSRVVYRVRTAGPFSVTVGEEERRFLHRHEVLPWLLWRINRDVVGSVDVPVIHGAAATHGDSTVVCCGDSGAGKSTLVAGLVASGFGYVTDEAVACEETGRVSGWTRPLALHPRSVDLLQEGFGARLSDELQIGAHGERLVRPDALGSVDDGVAPPVGTVILLEGLASLDGPPVLLRPSEALVALAAHVLAPSRRDETTLRSIAALLDTARAWRVPRRPVPEMVDLVRDVMHQPRSEQFRG